MKIVREHINERFSNESDPVHDMEIGAIEINFSDKMRQYRNDDMDLLKATTKWCDWLKTFDGKIIHGNFQNKFNSDYNISNAYLKINHINSYGFGAINAKLELVTDEKETFLIILDQNYFIINE